MSPATDGNLTAHPSRPTHPHLSSISISLNSYYPLVPQIPTIQPNLLQIIGNTFVMYLRDPQKLVEEQRRYPRRIQCPFPLLSVRRSKPFPFYFSIFLLISRLRACYRATVPTRVRSRFSLFPSFSFPCLHRHRPRFLVSGTSRASCLASRVSKHQERYRSSCLSYLIGLQFSRTHFHVDSYLRAYSLRRGAI